ncbi:POK18 protein, partial [Chionis minor]|nr:POK18 protein [Chionis minor]
PWSYLGWCISDQSVIPKTLKIVQNIKTLNDIQKLLGTINGVRPLLGISNEDLHPLF